MLTEGATVISAAADRKSMFPPLCQILKTSVTTALGVRGIKEKPV